MDACIENIVDDRIYYEYLPPELTKSTGDLLVSWSRCSSTTSGSPLPRVGAQKAEGKTCVCWILTVWICTALNQTRYDWWLLYLPILWNVLQKAIYSITPPSNMQQSPSSPSQARPTWSWLLIYSSCSHRSKLSKCTVRAISNSQKNTGFCKMDWFDYARRDWNQRWQDIAKQFG